MGGCVCRGGGKTKYSYVVVWYVGKAVLQKENEVFRSKGVSWRSGGVVLDRVV